MYFCKLEDGIVVDRAVFDAEMPGDWPDRDLWVHDDVAQIGWGMKEGALVPPTPLPASGMEPQPYRLFKSAVIRRLTSEEAETMEAVLAQADAKLRLMFNSVEYFVSDDPLFDTLKVAVGAALGEPRAEELLAPEH